MVLYECVGPQIRARLGTTGGQPPGERGVGGPLAGGGWEVALNPDPKPYLV